MSGEGMKSTSVTQKFYPLLFQDHGIEILCVHSDGEITVLGKPATPDRIVAVLASWGITMTRLWKERQEAIAARIITKEEFITRYCERSCIKDYELVDQVALRCACGYEGCEGWAMVSNNPLSIKAHQDLYAPSSSATQSRPGA